MSKHETPMTRWYWRTVNKRQGLLIEEFPAVKRDGSAGKNKRHIDEVSCSAKRLAVVTPAKATVSWSKASVSSSSNPKPGALAWA